jgi:ABC-type Fe3+/spermidine/putrescine transport system ATPase subunit
MTAAIETSGLTKQYRRVTALGDCTISVPEGRISALVGPNGAGKTTLLRLLTGLDPAWAVEEPDLEEIVLGYMSQDIAQGAGPEAARLSAIGGDR